MYKRKLLCMFIILLLIIQCKSKIPKIEMIYVEKGNFIMGNNNGAENEKPEHKVVLTRSFYISKYEITFDQYDMFCEDLNKDKPTDRGWGRGKNPVIHVNWYNAAGFCNWLSKKEGYNPCYSEKIIYDEKLKLNKNIWICDFDSNGYRLPTEAEWEYAARGGNKSKGYLYSGSNNPEKAAWFSSNSESKINPVGLKKPNELGLYDMSGNVNEWCWDSHLDDFYKISPEVDPSTSYVRNKVKRGGSWKSPKNGIRNTFRNSDLPNPDWAYDIGFRIVRSAFE